jgi:hypothetical protein
MEELRHVLEPRDWPTVPGVVTESRISDDMVPAVPPLSRAHPRIVTRFHVRYAYTIHGREYSSTRLNLLPRTGRQDSRSLVARYPINAAVIVYYDAHDPATAVIDTSIPIASAVQVTFGGAVAGVGLWFLMRRTHRVANARS